MMLEHQVTLKGLNISHLDSMNNEKSDHVPCSHKEQSSSITIRILETKQLDEVNDKLEICPHRKLKEINSSMCVVPHSLVHTNPVFMSQTHLKSPTTRNNSSPIITFSFAPPEFKNKHLFASHSFQTTHPFIFTNHYQQHQTSKISFPALKQTMNSELQETSASVPKMVKPITIVPPKKSKGKTPTKSSSKKNKLAKSKMETT